MVVGIVGKLEDVGRLRCLVLVGIPVCCRVFVQDGVGIGGNVFVGVEGDEAGGTNASVDIVGHEALAQACHDNVIRDGRELGEVGDRLETLVNGRLAIHGDEGNGCEAEKQTTLAVGVAELDCELMVKGEGWPSP